MHGPRAHDLQGDLVPAKDHRLRARGSNGLWTVKGKAGAGCFEHLSSTLFLFYSSWEQPGMMLVGAIQPRLRKSQACCELLQEFEQMRASMEPLFYQAGVDVVFYGHGESAALAILPLHMA